MANAKSVKKSRRTVWATSENRHQFVERNKAIRRRHKEGWTLSEIGAEFNLSRQRIFQIVKGRGL